jgi:hypothetical protein
MHVWWTATGLGCAWDICNIGRGAAQADRTVVCGIILQIDDGPVSMDPKSFAAAQHARSTHTQAMPRLNGRLAGLVDAWDMT